MKVSTLIGGITLASMMTLAPLSGSASQENPGEGKVVQPARATWNTGFFQEAIVRKGLETLGYEVKDPKDLQNPLFYKSVTLGDVDYWVNVPKIMPRESQEEPVDSA